jgi:DNA-binding MarR family transcriptional regulator
VPSGRLKLDCACLQLRQAARLVSQHYDNVLRPSGLRSTQFAVMAAIQANEPIALPDLAEGLVVDRSTLTRNLGPLERSGYVKLADRRGERVRFVKLTAKGRRAMKAATPLWQEAQERFVAQVGKRRWRSLSREIDDLLTAAEDA